MIELEYKNVEINGNSVANLKKPSFKKGKPKIKVSPNFVGDSVDVTQSRDYSEAVSEVKIIVPKTTTSLNNIAIYNSKVGTNNIKLIDDESGSVLVFNKMSLIEDVDYQLDGEDGLELTFQGKPIK